MELIEKYLYAVGKRLPMKQSKDIVAELRSVIMDNLDDKMKGEEPTEEDITQVLLEMGPPNEVAKSYRTEPTWIIGPRMFDTYILILKIALAAMLGGYLISIIVLAVTSGDAFWDMMLNIGKNLLSIIPGAFTTVGIVTIIFVILERTLNKPLDIDFKEEGKWHPSKLESVPSKEEIIKPLENILGIVFTIFAIIIFNVYRTKLGIYYFPSGGQEWVMVKAFNPDALKIYIPLWTVTWALSIGLYGWLLSLGKHNTSTRIFEMFISALSAGILLFIAKEGRMFEFDQMPQSITWMQPFVDFITKHQSSIFYLLAVLSVIGFLTLLGKFIYKWVKGIQN